MKLDLLSSNWLEIVFEGRNKKYGAYDFRKSITKNSTRAFLFGSFIFALLVSIPMISRLIPESSDDTILDTKITTVKLPPKEKKPKDALPPPPPPPPAPPVDVVKFVKPVVAKAEEVVEEIVEVKKLEDKQIGSENIKGDPDADIVISEPVGTGPAAVIEEKEDLGLYSSTGVEVQPQFPGGINKFYDFVGKNFVTPEEEGLNGKVFVSFVVERDGSLTDIKVLRDIGFGTGKEAIRVLNRSPRWAPAEQNGKKVRCTYTLPITIQTASE